MTDLTDRMRTCAARIASITDPARNDHSINDAVDLLIEAATLLECVADRGEIIPIVNIPPASTGDAWIAPGGPLPGLKRSGTISPRACPRCDSRANKRVRRQGNSLVLECSVCGHAWKYT